MKLMELKGVKIELSKHSHEVLHRPQLLSSFEQVLALEITHEENKLGMLYLESNFLGLLLHKVLGGGDRVPFTPAKLPLGKIEAKSLESAFGIFNLSLREGLKRSFPLRQIDFIKLDGPLNEFQYPDHLKGAQYLKEEFIFKTNTQNEKLGLTLLIDTQLFKEGGK